VTSSIILLIFTIDNPWDSSYYNCITVTMQLKTRVVGPSPARFLHDD
jgi:hypothetical protein